MAKWQTEKPMSILYDVAELQVKDINYFFYMSLFIHKGHLLDGGKIMVTLIQKTEKDCKGVHTK